MPDQSAHANYLIVSDGAWDVEPCTVGVVQDWGCSCQPILDQFDAQQMVFDDAYQAGKIERPVRQVIIDRHGPPFGTSESGIRAWQTLVDEHDVMAVIGPRQTDNAVAFARLGLAEARQVPTLSDCGNHLFPSEYGFCLPNGTFMDEGPLMVGYLVSQGAKRIGIFREDNPIADLYMDWIRGAVGRAGVSIVAEWIEPTNFDRARAEQALEYIRDSGADSLLYTGFASSGEHWFDAVQDSGWEAPRVLNSIFMGSIPGLGYGFEMRHFEGWGGIDQFDERNEVFQGVLDRFEARFGRRPLHCYLPLGYDFANVLVEGLAAAKPQSRNGLRDGLERVRMLPASIGSPGTHISFARYDHRGYKGPYIVIREVRDGKNVLSKYQGF